MPGSELRHDSSDRRGMALNSILGVAAESVSAAAEVMLLPSLILAFFVAELHPVLSHDRAGTRDRGRILDARTAAGAPARPIPPATATVGLCFNDRSRRQRSGSPP